MQARGARVRPHLDDKILTGWNGLMISAFALGGAVLGEARYAAAARRAAEFIEARLYDSASGTLRRRYRAGEAAIPGFLDDYALFAKALLDLYEAQFDPRHLELALALTEKMRELFEDAESGGIFQLRGGRRGGDPARERGLRRGGAFGEFGGGGEPAAPGGDHGARGVSRVGGPRAARLRLAALACAGGDSADAGGVRVAAGGAARNRDCGGGRGRRWWRRCAGDSCRTGSCCGWTRWRSRERLASVAPWTEAMRAPDGRPAAFVCRDHVCQLPVSDPARFAELIQ